MQIHPTPLPGLLIVQPDRFEDARGFFSESWNKRALADLGITTDFVQDNHSLSHARGTVRGLHYQEPPAAQAKLVRCSRGTIYDVAVDIRRGSPTYGQHFGVELSFENGKQLFVPEGMLHGFMTLEEDCEINYKCSDYYSKQHDRSVRWDSCGIQWPQSAGDPVLSDKDRDAPLFEDLITQFSFQG